MAYGAFAETKSRYRDLEALVDYHEFDGPHTVPAEIAQAAVSWFTG